MLKLTEGTRKCAAFNVKFESIEIKPNPLGYYKSFIAMTIFICTESVLSFLSFGEQIKDLIKEYTILEGLYPWIVKPHCMSCLK